MTAPTLTKEEFVAELIDNYEFWAATCYMIRDKGNALVPLYLNDVQREIGRVEEEMLREKGEARIYVLKARQGGVSTDQQARALHCIWKQAGANAMTLAHTSDDTAKLFQITRRGVREFPPELLPRQGKGDSREIRFVDMDSSLWTGTAGAKRAGRGVTLTRVHASEFAFWENPRATLANITPALIPRGSIIVLETTPDEYDSEAHQFWKESKEGKTGYRALFFPWWLCDPVNYCRGFTSAEEEQALKDSLTDEERSLVGAFGLTPEQINWRRKKINEIGRARFLREYPEDDETCWIMAGEKFYDAAAIEILLRKAPKPISEEYAKAIKVYGHRGVRTPNGIIYEDVIMGCDTAEGSLTGVNDRFTWTARSFPSWRLLSTFASSTIEPDEYTALLARWGMEMYGDALLVIEKNFHGITVLRNLRDKIYNGRKYPRVALYHRTSLASASGDQKQDLLGWMTTGESKPLMLDYGREILSAQAQGFIGVSPKETLIDFLAVTDGQLTGRDMLVSEILAWAGREYQVRRKVKVKNPINF